MFISGSLVLSARFSLNLESLSQEDPRGYLVSLHMSSVKTFIYALLLVIMAGEKYLCLPKSNLNLFL